MPAKYSFDTNIFIENWNTLYPVDVFPSVWEFVASLMEQGLAVVSREVMEELKKKDDSLLAWMKPRDALLIPTDGVVQAQTTQINDAFPTLVDVERERNLADPFVIAVAEIRGCSVVSYEKPRTKATKPHKIPDVCAERGLGTECISFIEVARREGFRL